MTRTREEDNSENYNNQKPNNVGNSSKSTTKFRTGRITRNPFLNFLRDMRRNARGLTITQVAVKGGDLWRKMAQEEKQPYCQLAKQARRTSKRGRRRRRKSRGRRRGRRRAFSYAKSSRRSRRRSRSKSRRKSRSRY